MATKPKIRPRRHEMPPGMVEPWTEEEIDALPNLLDPRPTCQHSAGWVPVTHSTATFPAPPYGLCLDCGMAQLPDGSVIRPTYHESKDDQDQEA